MTAPPLRRAIKLRDEATNAGPQISPSLSPVLIPLGLIVPTLIWILLDTQAWGGDQSQYGFATLDLFHTMTHTPSAWPRRLLEVFPFKANLIIWLGQPFAALAYLTSRPDQSLLLMIGLAQLSTLVLIYRALASVSTSRYLVPVVACFVVASAPLFVSLGQHYLVESLQTLSVAWFVSLMCLAPGASRSFIFAHLLGATAFAMAAKVSQPVFCVWPGLAACYWLWRPQSAPATTQSRRQARLILALSVPLMVATVAWYVSNIAPAMALVREGAYGPGVSIYWGKNDTYANTVLYWISTAGTGLFLQGIGILAMSLAFAAGVHYLFRRGRQPATFTCCAAIAGLQIVTVILVFSLSPTRQLRYFLPALPYIALIVGWSVAQIDHWAVTRVTIAALCIQFLLVWAQAFNVRPALSVWVRPFDKRAHNAAVMASIVARTCGASGPSPSWNILAVDPGIPAIGGDWLAPDPANYLVAKNRLLLGGSLPCHYGYVGDGFFGAPVAEAWASALARGTRYIVTTDPSRYAPPALAFNKALSQENFPVLLRTIETSGEFIREPALAEDPGLLIFRRRSLDHVMHGRELSDSGDHPAAVAELTLATNLQPANAEAWANLAFAYERQGDFERAVQAGLEARRLSPNHYYVNLGLARAFAHLERWSDAATAAKSAAAHAPSVRDQVTALEVAASSLGHFGDQRQKCALLAQAAALDPGQRLLTELLTQGCGG